MRLLGFLIPLLFLTSAVPAAAQAAPSRKLDLALRAAAQSGAKTHRVIIRVTPGARGRLKAALQQHGDVVLAEHPLIDAVTAEVHTEDLETLADYPSIVSLSSNARVHANAVTAYESTGTVQALHDTLGLTAASPTGKGVVVALVDSGLQAEFDTNNRIVEFWDFTQSVKALAHPIDPYGHGTHIGGLIGGPADKQVGIAPDTRFVVLRVLDEYGRGYTSDVLSAIEFAIQEKDRLGIDIINLSLGHRIYESAATDPLVQAVERAVRAGIIVVVAAGNAGTNPSTGVTGYAGILSPGNAPSAITVGAADTKLTATRSDDVMTGYSSRGPTWQDGFAKPDVVAPGHRLVSNRDHRSTLYLDHPELRIDDHYFMLSGTSMAAGVVTGVVALMLEAQSDNFLCLCEVCPPPLTPNAVKAFLQYSALPIKDGFGAPLNALIQGPGSLNAAGAVSLADAVDTSVNVGLPWLIAGVLPYTTIAGELLDWSQRMMWGNHFARGTGVISEQRPAWALDIVWGEGIEDDDNIVWGNALDDLQSLVWGNLFDADDNIVWGNNLVWGHSWSTTDNVLWGTLDDDNIVWGNSIVWGNGLVGIVQADGTIVWGGSDDDNIVWGNVDDDNIVWGNLDDDNIVWGNNDDDNIVWGNFDDDNIVWGNSAALGNVTQTAGGAARQRKVVR